MKITPAPILPPLPPDEYEQLRESIRELGVQVPILITDDGMIIDGHERHRVTVELGLRRYPLRVLGGLSDADRRVMAVRLNIERRHLTPTQRRLLIEAELRSDPARSDRATADIFGCDHKTVGSVRRRMETNGEIPRCSRKSSDGRVYRPPSVGVETLHAAREAARLLPEVGDDVEGGLTLRDARKAAWAERFKRANDLPAARLPAEITIKQCDFRKLPVDDASVDLILTDPPWDQHHRHLLEPMAERFHRWLKPGGMLLCYVGSFALPFFLDTFRAAGLTYQWLLGATNFPKADEAHVPYGAMKNGGRFSAALRPLLLFSKGKDFHLNKTPTDVVFTQGRDERTHPLGWQQPLEESSYFVEHFSHPGASIIDPFVGSGTTAVAVAMAGQGRRFVGCDVDTTCVKIARRRVSEAVSNFCTR